MTPQFSVSFLVLVFAFLLSSQTIIISALPFTSSTSDVTPSVQDLAGKGVNLELRSVAFLRKRSESNPRSVLDQLNNPGRRYFPFHPGSPPSHYHPHPSSDPSTSSTPKDVLEKRAYVNPLLDHLRNSYKNGSADILPWTEAQKEGHKFKLGAVIDSVLNGEKGKGGGDAAKGVLKAAVAGGADTGKANSTVVNGNVMNATVVGFDAWPASVRMVVQPKGNAQSGYSPNSLAILQAQSARGDDQDRVTHSSGTIAAQSVDYSVFSVDTGYIADIDVGSQGKAYSMLIDTGSADTWIGNKDCQKCRTTLSGADSSTFKLGTYNFDITYGLGSASMTSATDKVGIAGMSVDQFDFGSAHTVDDQFTSPSTPFAGILGTAQGVLTAQGVRTLPERLMDTGAIPNAVVAYALGRVADGENNGQLTIGGFDPAKQNGETTQILDVTDNIGFWKARMGAVMVDGDVAVPEGRVVILDTGTTLMDLPPADADAIHLLIEGAAPDGQGGYTVPCTMTEIIYLQFGSVALSIDPRDITWLPVDVNQPKGRCLSSITGSAIDGQGTWLIGDPFLKNVYMVTDTGNNKIHLSAREGTQTTKRGV